MRILIFTLLTAFCTEIHLTSSITTQLLKSNLKSSDFYDVPSIHHRSSGQNGEIHKEVKINEDAKCIACKVIAEMVYELVKEKRDEADIVKEIIKICIEAKIEDERVCKYIVPQYKDMALAVVRKDLLSPDQMCGLIFGPSCATPYDPLDMWNVTLPDTPKPPVFPPKPPAPGAPRVRFVQLTDIHIDMMYEEGRNPLCGEPLCCRSNDAMPAPGVPGAGHWGDYRHCDVPLRLVDNLFQELARKKDQFDFVIFTGDIAAHDVWNQSRSDQVSALERLVSYFEKYLPGKPVYFTAGNHDSSPCDSFPPPYITGNNSENWMYDAMATNWGKWLPKETQLTIKKAGYYTVSPYPGFRIIAVNNNFCYIQNWWLFINTTDPAGQLHWLAQALQMAEDKGEKVYILQHHPTNCMKAWSWNFYRIVDRYENTIIGQFNGHTHTDEFRVYYDDVTLSRPLHVSYVAGAVTPYHGRNPNYRIYAMDGFYSNSSFAILDYEDFVFNISKNNEVMQPKWELEYSPLTEYNMKGVTPADWSDLIYRMKTDDELFNRFHLHISKGGDASVCDKGCKLDVLCKLKSGKSEDPRLCYDIYD